MQHQWIWALQVVLLSIFFFNFSGIEKPVFFSGLFIPNPSTLGVTDEIRLGEGFAKWLRLTFELEETQPGKYKEPQDVDSGQNDENVTREMWGMREVKVLVEFSGIFLGLYCIQLRFWKGKGVYFFF